MSGSNDDNELRRWSVAAGLLLDHNSVLLVANRRRNGSVDWSPPGGVIDPGERPLEALSREVIEETGLVVEEWSEPIYRVEVIAPHDGGFHLDVQVHRAFSYSGELTIDDPDGIVFDARFVERDGVSQQVAGSPPWVVEPLLEWSNGNEPNGHLYRYRLMIENGERQVLRLHDSR